MSTQALSYFSIVPPEVSLDHRLSPIEMRVLIALFSFRCKNTNMCWPSRQVLGGRCGYTEQTVSRAITGLKNKGWLEVQQHRGPNTYKIIVPDLETQDHETVSDPDTVSNNQGKTTTYANDQQSHQNSVSLINGVRPGHETVSDPDTPEQTKNIPLPPYHSTSDIAPHELELDLSSSQGTDLADHTELRGNPQALRNFNTSQVKRRKSRECFDAWWDAYPKKVDKQNALKYWLKNWKTLDPITETLISDVRLRVEKHGQWRDKQYIPGPAKYLRDKKWEDEVIPISRKASDDLYSYGGGL